MVWAAISYRGFLSMVGMEDNLGSKYYFNVIKQALIPKASEMYGDVWALVLDNLSVHAVEYTKSWLESQDVYVLPWLPKSLDSNIVENIW